MMLEGQARPGSPTCCSANPAAVYMDLMRFALIDGYGSEQPAPARLGASPAAGPLLIGVGGFVYFWKAEERYGRG